MTTNTSMLHVRLNSEIKAQAANMLNTMGLSMSEAVRLFIHHVVSNQAFPFELKVPNAETLAAMAEAKAMTHARFTSADELFNNLEN